MKLFFSDPWFKRGLFFLIFAFCLPLIASAVDMVDKNFDPQPSTSTGSNGSTVWFSTGGTSTGTTSYWNQNNDSTIIGNYLRGYYYDTNLWFFELDWNTTATGSTQNVHIASSTDKCSGGYGYKFSWYAQSEAAGFINFNYSDDIFVYYCESDKKLHGHAYSEHTGFQSFEWISFEALIVPAGSPGYTFQNNPFFVNDNTVILMGLDRSSTDNASTNNTSTDIQGESVANKKGKEVIFYIVK